MNTAPAGNLGGNLYKWNEDNLRELALKYNTRGEMMRNDRNAFESIKSKNLYHLFDHMKWEGNIEHTLEDFSERVLENKLCVESSLKPFVNALNRFRWNTYKVKLDQWIYDNLDIDLVLDRIGQCGMDNLRPVEKKFLRNFQN